MTVNSNEKMKKAPQCCSTLAKSLKYAFLIASPYVLFELLNIFYQS